MATRIWQSSDGDWGNTASWTTATVPITGDDVIFPSNNQVSVTSGLSQGAVDLASLVIHPGYGGDVGLTGTHLTISATKVLHEGTGTLFYTDGTGTTDRVIVNSTNKVNAATLSGSLLTRITVIRGKVTLDSALGAVSILESSFFASQSSDADVVIETGAGTITDLFMNGGQVDCGAAVTTLTQSAGKFIHNEAASGAIATINQTGGQLVYNDDGNITLANIMGGELDFGQNARTLTIAELKVWPGARVINPTDRITVTAGGQLLERTTIGSPV